MIATIALRELRGLFLSPLAWSVLAVLQFILAYMFLARIDAYMMVQPQLAGIPGAPGITDIIVTPLFGNAAIILLMVIPLLTMRLVSEERRAGTLSLLLSAPVSMSEIILGKFLGLFGFLLCMLGLIVLMPLSLLTGGGLDFGKLAAALLGMALVLGSFAAVGLYMSTLTSQPTVAAISTFGILLLLWIIDWAGNREASGILDYLSLLRHYQSLLQGLFKSGDVIYYLLVITTFLGLSIRRLDADRLQQ